MDSHVRLEFYLLETFPLVETLLRFLPVIFFRLLRLHNAERNWTLEFVKLRGAKVCCNFNEMTSSCEPLRADFLRIAK